MSYKPHSLYSLIQGIERQEIFLPHIQRSFVWEEDQIARFFDSLMRNYPFQTILFWRTKEAIKARRFMDVIDWEVDLHTLYDKTKSADGVEKTFVLDGQQRLQTLFAIFHGGIANGKAVREAYINITEGAASGSSDLAYNIVFSEAPLHLPMFRVRDLMEKESKRNAADLSDDVNDSLDSLGLEANDPDARKLRHRRVRSNFTQLGDLLRTDRFIWIDELDGIANKYPYELILDIFVRVNSGGTKLTSADLLFAVLKEGWEEVEELVEESAEQLSGCGVEFEKDLALKCVMLATGQGAVLSPQQFRGDQGGNILKAIKADWQKAEAAFNLLADFLTHDVVAYDAGFVRSNRALAAIFDFLYHNTKPDATTKHLLRAFFYKSQLFNWFGAQTDQILNVLHTRLGKQQGGFPMTEVKDYFRGRGRDVEFTRDTLLEHRLRHILLNIVYVDSFGASPFQVAHKNNSPEVDHIYPKSKLEKVLGQPPERRNIIGNYRFVAMTDNRRKRAEAPDAYFTRLKNAGVPVGKHLLAAPYATDPSCLKMDVSTYDDFLSKRLDAMHRICHNVINAELPSIP